ncbi:hypothetical protein [Rhodoferax aquaticus]|uniref:Uncharacterized protein n=1 Tax=Rhodoferax aquaticus TaxID=2527691 RepID=A0A515ENS0_9BURK|nr:hypothetical protein [Rhodoferax aquaticus]QDL54280.1 hypothetical protein EXZ61_08935 [Rhodoferax aquaticus]
MIFFSQFIRTLLIACLFFTVSAFATDPSLIYRGVTLGDELDKVQMLIASEFPRINVIDRNYLVKAGDDEGMQRDSCAYAATSNRQKNCILANFGFSRQLQLNNVYVEQSFMPAISLESLMGKLSKSYGSPRLTFREIISASPPSNTAFVSPASELTSLVWGGSKTPSGSYRNSSFPFEALERIGGKFVSVSIFHQGNLVNGYSLRILDEVRAKSNAVEMMQEIEQQEAAGRAKSDGSVKF